RPSTAARWSQRCSSDWLAPLPRFSGNSLRRPWGQGGGHRQCLRRALCSSDPLSTEVVASLARPGGKITGLSLMGAGLSTKGLELLQIVVPGISRVVALSDALKPGMALRVHETQLAEDRILRCRRAGSRGPRNQLRGAVRTTARSAGGDSGAFTPPPSSPKGPLSACKPNFPFSMHRKGKIQNASVSP